MAGYLGDAERTAASMRDGFFHTGDVAVRDADGKLTFVGRTDDIFKSSDYKVSPFEVESALLRAPGRRRVRRRAGARRRPAQRRQGLRHARRRLGADGRDRAGSARARPRRRCRPTSGCAGSSSRSCRRRSRARSAASSCASARSVRPLPVSVPLDGEWRDDQFPELRGSRP